MGWFGSKKDDGADEGPRSLSVGCLWKAPQLWACERACNFVSAPHACAVRSKLSAQVLPSLPSHHPSHPALRSVTSASAEGDRATKRGSARFLPSMFSRFSMRTKGSVADAGAEDKEIRPEVHEDVEISEHGQTPLQAGIPLPGNVGHKPARQPEAEQDDIAEEPRGAMHQRADQVKAQAKLVNSAWEDSESSDDFDEQGTLDRVIEICKEDAANMNPERKNTQPLIVVRFERRKRQIANRFQTRRALAEFEQEEGRQVGGQWIDQKWIPNKMLNIQRDQFTISKWMKDLSTYLILLIAFTYIIFTGSGNSEFVSYQRAWRKLLSPRGKQITTPESALIAIEQLVLDDLVGKEQPYVPGYLPPGGKGSGVLLASILVGKIRIRQLRVKGVKCSHVHAMLTSYGIVASKECYPPFNLMTEEIVYTKEMGSTTPEYEDSEKYPFFEYFSPMQSNQPDTVGRHGRYHAGGYIVAFDLPDASTTLATLRNMQWLDKKTKVLFLDFTYYNDDVGLFVSCSMQVEFVSGHAPVTTVQASGISPMRFRSGNSSDIARLAMMVLVFVMVIYYMLEELDLCRATGLDRYKSIGWPYLDAINITLFVVSGLLKGYNLISYEIAIPIGVTDEDMIARVTALGQSQYLDDKIQGLNGFLLWFKLFKYVTITRPLMRMSRVLGTCIPDILTYGFLFSVVLISFAVLGYLFCGNELATFSSMELSMLTILRSMYGDFDFDGLIEVSGVTGFIYLGLWLITSNVVMLNMFIAILSEAYRKVGEEERNEPSDTTWNKILEEVQRRRKESNDLREEAIGVYGRQRYLEQQRQREKGRFERLYGWVYFKVTGKMLEEEEEEEEEKKDEEDHDDAQDDPDSKKPVKQELAMLDWMPWDTTVETVAAREKAQSFLRQPTREL